MFSFIKRLIFGLLIGLSNIVPGVSGGTIACVLGVYEDLLVLPAVDVKKLKDRWQNILPLFVGMGLGILLFAKLVTYLYATYPIYTSYFFVGMIFASIPLLFDVASYKDDDSIAGKNGEPKIQNLKLKVLQLCLCLLALFIMTFFYVLKRRGVVATVFSFDGIEKNLIFYLVLILYCAIASAGMIIPGISGSFLLLLLGAYQVVMEAIASFDVKLLLCIALGVLLGAVSMARIIKFLVTRFEKQTYSFILGLILGSILHIFPVVCQPFKQRFISVLILLSGYVLVSIFIRKSNKELLNE